ncbi:MAG: hypothetical protein ACKOEM_04275, partial [Planctomycetia bacterium]
LVVEHNLEVIAAADWVIDMGPEAGAGGGRIVAEGPPEDLVIQARRWQEAGDHADRTRVSRCHTGEALAGFFEPTGAHHPPGPTTTAPPRRSARPGETRCHTG